MAKLSKNAFLTLGMLAALSTSVLAADSATIANYGGASGETFSKVIWQPAAKELGITIKEDSLSGVFDVRNQVNANAVAWDVVEFGVDECATGEKEGLFETIDREAFLSMGYEPQFVTNHYVLVNTASYMIAYNAKKFGDNGPKTWADFWNTEKFPGTRALRDNPSGNLEAALFADGVGGDKIYPIDLDRAYAKLTEIKPHIQVWWSSGAQSAQLVRDGEVDIIGIWNSRFEPVAKSGAPYNSTFNQGILIGDCMAIPRGVKDLALATKLLSIGASPIKQAQSVEFSPNSPVAKTAFDLGVISEERAKELPGSPENVIGQVWMDGAWWADSGVEAQTRWTDFMQQ